MTVRALQKRGPDPDASRVRIARLSLGHAVTLHPAPGVLTVVAFIVVAGVFRGRAVPPQLALLVAILAFGVPFQLGYLRWWRRRAGADALRGVILYRRPVARRRMAMLAAGLVICGLVALTLLEPLAEAVRVRVFGWWPEWLSVAGPVDDVDRYDPGVLWLVVGLSAVARPGWSSP